MPRFQQWWKRTYVDGKRTINNKRGKVETEFMMPRGIDLCFNMCPVKWFLVKNHEPTGNPKSLGSYVRF